jgi:hypothetical protein
MKRLVKVQFLMENVFEKYFTKDDFIVPNVAKIHSRGADWMVFKDDIKDNDEGGASHNILSFIKEVIGLSPLLENKEIMMSTDATALGVQLGEPKNRTICKVVETKVVED